MFDENLASSFNLILGEEISGYQPSMATRPFDELGIDSFGLISLRVRVERLIGKAIADSDWTVLNSPDELFALIAESSRGSDEGCEPAQEQFTGERHYRLNMPQMALGGLSESWLFKELGDLHWSMITEGLRMPSDGLIDGQGERLYATFTRVRTTSAHSLSSFGENEEMVLNGDIARLGAGIFLSDMALSGEDKSISATIMSSFAKRSAPTSNVGLLKGQPTIPPECPIRELADMPQFGLEYKQRRDGALPDSLFSRDYEIVPYHDINGVGLLYFAAYPVISDICELRYIGEGNRWAARASTVARDVYYFANSNIDDTLTYAVHAKREVDNCIEIESSISRATDSSLMAYVKTRKTLIDG